MAGSGSVFTSQSDKHGLRLNFQYLSAFACVKMEALVFTLLLLLMSTLTAAQDPTTGPGSLEEEARRLLEALDERASRECTLLKTATWNYETNITQESQQAQVAAALRYAQWEKEQWEQVTAWKDRWPKLEDDFLRRQFELRAVLGLAALSEDDLQEYNGIVAEMLTIFSTAKTCRYTDPSTCDLNLDPDLKRILRTSRDYAELEHVWRTWRDSTGRRMRPLFRRYVDLANKAAKHNGFANMGDMWIVPYENKAFRQDMNNLWNQVKPLYEQLHAYVRRKLKEVYKDKISSRGPLPAHVLGNMWAQSWTEIYDLLAPYPGKEVDVTAQMQHQGYTPLRMFKLSEEFFTSLNLTAMPQVFWDRSIIERPTDREMVCHASAWDFCDGVDFRVKQCTDVTMKYLVTVHHEMGHTENQIQFKHLPQVFRRAPNGGFHEAIGDIMSLSVSTPKHMHKVGLLPEFQDDYETEINFLLKMALERVAFLPFGYLIDLWRWDVFSGATPEEEWNCAWWKLRYDIQGIVPPSPSKRTESDLDPGAKYHIAADDEYISYFVARVVQFQFHQALCLLASEYDPENPAKPLHKCDIYQSAAAGKKLAGMLQMGASKHWSEAMLALTGQAKMDAGALREYFKPLEEWLRKDNEKNGEIAGWESDGVYCSKSE